MPIWRWPGWRSPAPATDWRCRRRFPRPISRWSPAMALGSSRPIRWSFGFIRRRRSRSCSELRQEFRRKPRRSSADRIWNGRRWTAVVGAAVHRAAVASRPAAIGTRPGCQFWPAQDWRRIASTSGRLNWVGTSVPFVGIWRSRVPEICSRSSLRCGQVRPVAMPLVGSRSQQTRSRRWCHCASDSSGYSAKVRSRGPTAGTTHPAFEASIRWVRSGGTGSSVSMAEAKG
jgi:hypothetical protein